MMWWVGFLEVGMSWCKHDRGLDYDVYASRYVCCLPFRVSLQWCDWNWVVMNNSFARKGPTAEVWWGAFRGDIGPRYWHGGRELRRQ